MSSSRRIRPSSPGRKPAGPCWLTYESTDSVGDLKSFYVQKIAALNMTVLTTTERREHLRRGIRHG